MSEDTIGSFRTFLEYGPMGLAGLMLVLVIFALTLGSLTPARERTLRLFMFVGAFCFVAALAAQFFAEDSEHELRLTVAPNDLGENSRFPPPIIRVNGERIDRVRPVIVGSATTVLVDVTDAFGIYRMTEEKVAAQAAVIRVAEQTSTELRAELSRIQSEGVRAISAEEVQRLQAGQNRLFEALKPFR